MLRQAISLYRNDFLVGMHAEWIMSRREELQRQYGDALNNLARNVEQEGDTRVVLDGEEAELRPILGDLIFGIDDETMEHAVIQRLDKRGSDYGAIFNGLTVGQTYHILIGNSGGWAGSTPGAFTLSVQ